MSQYYDWLHYCMYCGNIQQLKFPGETCKYCKNKLSECRDFSLDEYLSANQKKKEEMADLIYNKYISNSRVFSRSLKQNRINSQNKIASALKPEQPLPPTIDQSQSEISVICPMCKSTQIQLVNKGGRFGEGFLQTKLIGFV